MRGSALAAASQAMSANAGARNASAEPGIRLPADHYAHPGAPTEWWWNIGTLRAGERIFGFEINAASYVGQGGFAFTQVMLTDVANDRHYQQTTPFLSGPFNCATWAESDPAKPWRVALGSPANALSTILVTNPGSGYQSAPAVEIAGGGGAEASANLNAAGGVATIDLWNVGQGYSSEPAVTLTGGGGTGATAKAVHAFVNMSAPAGDPTQNMTVTARLVDPATGTVVAFDLKLSQQGPPFLVWGTGVVPMPLTCGSPLQTHNYYSLTRLQASGTISIDGETFDVSGVTWMDHQYGAFTTAGKPVKWILQDIQLDNGVSISSFSLKEPELGKPTTGMATVQNPNQPSTLTLSTITPRKEWRSPVTGTVYFVEVEVKLDLLGATLLVTSLVDSQEFPLAGGSIYEGVGRASGTFNKQQVSGTAWLEQTGR